MDKPSTPAVIESMKRFEIGKLYLYCASEKGKCAFVLHNGICFFSL